MGLSEVSNILWRERQLLQLLLFKLETEQLILSSARTRFLSDATREVEMVINELKETELLRAVAVDGLAAELGLGPSPSLRELAQVAPAPWDNIFEEHRKAFLEDTQEIFSMAQVNRELLSNGRRAHVTHSSGSQTAAKSNRVTTPQSTRTPQQVRQLPITKWRQTRG